LVKKDGCFDIDQEGLEDRVQNEGYRGGSSTAVQAWQPCPLWELSPNHPILV